MHDAWEVYCFGSTAADPMGDNAGDRMRNYQEFISGTDPLNPSSLLLIGGQDALQVSAAGFRLTWASVSNKLYMVERTTNLMAGFAGPLAADILATPPLNTYTNAAATNAVLYFYRIRVSSP